MSKLPTRMVLALAAALIAGCAGDDTVNPLPPPEAGADAAKDATAHDGASPHDGAADAKGAEASDATAKDASPKASADANGGEAGDAGTDGPVDAAASAD